MFVVGDYIAVPPDPLRRGDKGRLILVLSTRNLLMNGWRAQRSGGPLAIFIDGTYKLVVEGHPTVGVVVVDESQKQHVLAFAVVNKEDHGAVEHCARQIKAGVEATVQIYSRLGLTA